MRLWDGAEALRAELPHSAMHYVEVPSEAGADEDSGVLRISSVRQVRDSHSQALDSITPTERVITIGGDCASDLAGIQHADSVQRQLHPDGSMAVIWLDAHADLNTPASSPSGAFHGMVLRTLLGDGPSALVPLHPLSPMQVILAGTRALDEGELEFITSAGLQMIAPGSLDPASISAALVASGATSVYLHIDLDVLDPAEFESVGYPEPFGVTLSLLLEVIAAAKATVPLVGAALTEFAPASAEDAADEIGSILRIIGALAS